MCINGMYNMAHVMSTPIYDELTDARDNLSGALVFAGQYAVPEVIIY